MCRFFLIRAGAFTHGRPAFERGGGAALRAGAWRGSAAGRALLFLLLLSLPFAASTGARGTAIAAGTQGHDPAAGADAGSGPANGARAGLDPEAPSDPASPARAARPEADGPRYALPLLGSYRKSMEIETELLSACVKYSLSPALARAVLLYESGGNDGLVSGAGARGYFQVMPATFRLMKVPTNIEAGVKYLSLMVRDYRREDDALAAYNGGPGRLQKGRKLPMETLQYVVGVGIYRTLLTTEEEAIRAEASRLLLHRVAAGDTWASIAASTGIPVLELRLYNAFLAPRPLKPGMLIAHPRASVGSLFEASSAAGGPEHYVTRRGDNYLLLAFAFDVDLEQFREANALWRVQVPFEGMRLAVSNRPPRFLGPEASGEAAVGAPDPVAPTLSSAQPAAPDRASGGPPAAAPEGAPEGGERAAGPPSGPGDPARQAQGPPPGPLVHKVKRGETLYGIARQYGVSVETIREANKLRRSSLVAGQVLKIPLG